MFADLQVGLREELCEKCIEFRVELLELLACVAPVVLSVGFLHLCIDVEPVLHCLRPVFLDGGRTVGVVDDSALHGLVVERLESFVEVRLHLYDSDAVYGV